MIAALTRVCLLWLIQEVNIREVHLFKFCCTYCVNIYILRARLQKVDKYVNHTINFQNLTRMLSVLTINLKLKYELPPKMKLWFQSVKNVWTLCKFIYFDHMIKQLENEKN